MRNFQRLVRIVFSTNYISNFVFTKHLRCYLPLHQSCGFYRKFLANYSLHWCGNEVNSSRKCRLSARAAVCFWNGAFALYAVVRKCTSSHSWTLVSCLLQTAGAAAFLRCHQFAVSSFYICTNMKMQRPSRRVVKQTAGSSCSGEMDQPKRKETAAAI